MRFKRAWTIATLALATIACTGQVLAQDKAPKPDGPVVVEDKVVVTTGGPSEAIVTGGPNTFVFISSEVGFDQKIVKGAPYSAEATTETIQTLSDGNRIVRRNSATIYRDSEGRTRREQTLNALGPWTAAGDAPRTIFINDPVARINYVLDPKTQTARKVVIPMMGPGQTFMRVAPPAPGAVAGAPGIRVYENSAPAPVRERAEMPKPKVESLGRQTIEGVEAEGTRTTITIPAGKIGNERPIDIVTERWYSPELQTIILSKRSDPMAGETTYKLTNINRSEPLHSLFEVPAGYTIKETPGANFNYRLRRNEEK